MAVQRVVVLPVVIPFIQVTLRSDIIGMQPPQYIFVFGIFKAKNRTGCNGVRQQFANDGQIGSTTIAGHAVIAFICDIFVLWRRTGSRNQLSCHLRIVHQPRRTKVRRSLHQRIGHRAQIVGVLGKEIAFPQRVHQPRTTHIPVGPHRAFSLLAHRIRHGPEVGIMTGAPARLDTIIVAGGKLPIGGKSLDKGIQRLSHLGQIAHKHRPIVFLQIDVDGIVAPPRRPQLMCPQSLKIGRHPWRATTRDEQIASKLEVKRFQIAFSLGMLSWLVVILLEQLVSSTVVSSLS